jgi:hypothetical protein
MMADFNCLSSVYKLPDTSPSDWKGIQNYTFFRVRKFFSWSFHVLVKNVNFVDETTKLHCYF